MTPLLSALTTLILSLLLPHVKAVNVTVDDSSPLWSYSSVNNLAWSKSTSPCATCQQQPDASQAFNKTWSVAAFSQITANITFQGSSASVYGILPIANKSNIIANYTFDVLDSSGKTLSPRGSFLRSRANITTYAYNVSLFSVSGLDATKPTTLVITNQLNQSILMLDYLVYDNATSHGTLAPPTQSSQGISATLPSASSAASDTSTLVVGKTKLAGALAPVIVLVVLIFAGVGYFLYRRKKQRDAQRLAQITFMTPEAHLARLEKRNESILSVSRGASLSSRRSMHSVRSVHSTRRNSRASMSMGGSQVNLNQPYDESIPPVPPVPRAVNPPAPTFEFTVVTETSSGGNVVAVQHTTPTSPTSPSPSSSSTPSPRPQPRFPPEKKGFMDGPSGSPPRSRAMKSPSPPPYDYDNNDW